MRKQFIFGVVAAIAVALLPAVSAAPSFADDAAFATCTDLASCGGLSALVKAAQAEGTLNVTTILRNWADYGDAVDTFQAAFGIHINDDNPDGGSSYEINSIKTAPAESQPDVIDFGASHIAEAAGVTACPTDITTCSASIFANYKVATWNDIPANWKEVDGNWFGNYQGQIVIGYDAKLKKAPTKISDLTDPAYKKVVGIAGDPTAAQEALISVMAATVANGGTFANVQKGVDFYHKLKTIGNLSGATADSTHIATGNPKVWLDYSFNALGTEQLGAQIGKTFKYVKPADAAVMGTPYLFAVNATAPHPAAARLWVEYLMSENKGHLAKDLAGDEAANVKAGTLDGAKLFNSLLGGQNIFQLGGAVPIEIAAMTKKKLLVPSPSTIFVPSAGDKLAPKQPTVAQQATAIALLKTAWPKI
ncbi:MAG: ABC transporter substrate-binding protein [Actinomycetota bacterium]